MSKKEIIKRLREIKDGIDGDRFTVENIENLITDLLDTK